MKWLKVGDTVWYFDINRRVYPPRPEGRTYSSSPIWREHWRPCVIVGETSRSWLTDHYGYKMPKKGADPRIWATSQAEIDDQQWVRDHKHKMLGQVQSCHDPAILRQVAALVGYSPD